MPIKLQKHNNGNFLQLAETVKNLIILGQNINSEYQPWNQNIVIVEGIKWKTK